MPQDHVIQTGKIYYANDKMRNYRISIDGCIVLPTVETIAKAYIVNIQKPGKSRSRLQALSITLEKREGHHPVQFFTEDASDISKLLRDYGVRPPKGIQVIPQLEGRAIGAYVCYHTIAAVSPVKKQE